MPWAVDSSTAARCPNPGFQTQAWAASLGAAQSRTVGLRQLISRKPLASLGGALGGAQDDASATPTGGLCPRWAGAFGGLGGAVFS